MNTKHTLTTNEREDIWRAAIDTANDSSPFSEHLADVERAFIHLFSSPDGEQTGK